MLRNKIKWEGLGRTLVGVGLTTTLIGIMPLPLNNSLENNSLETNYAQYAYDVDELKKTNKTKVLSSLYWMIPAGVVSLFAGLGIYEIHQNRRDKIKYYRMDF